MAVIADHPAVRAYLTRLEGAAPGLPAARLAELRSEIVEHVAAALASSGRHDDAAVHEALDRLGPPEEVAAAEPGVLPPSARTRSWGPVEVVSVLALTLGTFLLPVFGPLIGLVLAWVSQQWTRREKVVATVLAVGLGLLPVLLAIGLFAATSGPVVVSPAQPQPASSSSASAEPVP